jgi:hypothetical protein
VFLRNVDILSVDYTALRERAGRTSGPIRGPHNVSITRLKVRLVRTDYSEERFASIFKVEEIRDLRLTLFFARGFYLH